MGYYADTMSDLYYAYLDAANCATIEINRNWESGIHKDRKGNVYKLKDMKTSHLKNTLNWFKNKSKLTGLKFEPLLEELKNRNNE